MHDLSRIFLISPDPLERRVIRDALNNSSNVEIIGAAANLEIAVRQFNNNRPDVLVISIDNGSSPDDIFIKHCDKITDISIIIYTKYPELCQNMTAFRGTNIDYIIIPRSSNRISESMQADKNLMELSINKSTARMRSCSKLFNRNTSLPYYERLSAPIDQQFDAKQWVIAIGASTGGTDAIAALLHDLPPSCPGIVLVQHMPADFTGSFARRLNDQCHFTVVEAAGGERIKPGHVIVANGAKHCEIAGVSGDYYVTLYDGPKESGHRPSVDVLFRSVAQVAGPFGIGVIMTGMGHDGANGLLRIKNCGGKTIAQDEASSVVFGMPRRAFEIGAVDELTPLPIIGQSIVDLYLTTKA